MYRPGHGIRLRCSARTDRGRVRQNNEDSVDLWAQDSAVLAVVADGMGGAVAGEEASRIAVETIRSKIVTDTFRTPDDYQDYDTDELAELLGDAIRDANQNIIDRAISEPELKGMGTTVTLAFIRYGQVILAHVGDSRAYYVDSADRSINQLTADHSFVQALVDAGHITEDEAHEHPMRNVLYRALGQAEDLDVDVHPDVRFHIGDRIVLCSDGLTLHLLPHEIAEIALEFDNPNDISDKLVDLANSRGGKDNVSAIVIVAEQVDQDEVKTMPADEVDLNFGEDDPTLPMNPDYLNITRVEKKSLDSIDSDDDPLSTHEMPSAGTYGEGKDTFDQF
jgi:PPM family protein phosphatase